MFNSKVPEVDTRNRTKAYRLALNEQNEILDKMENVIKNFKTGKALAKKKETNKLPLHTNTTLNVKQTNLPFQIGILISIKSLKLLYEDLKAEFNIKYLLTYHLNQDPLEGFFSIIRSIGGLHDHPSPLQFKFRLRNYILGRNDEVISDSSNVRESNVQNIMMANTLHCLENNITNKNSETVDKENVNIVTVQLLSDLLESDKSSCGIPENSELIDDFSEIEWDGLENIAGYIAFKFRKS